MPYNPGVTLDAGQSIGQGIARGSSRLMEALQWAFGQADQTKELRSTLDTIDPGNKEAHSRMGKGELQGKILGLQTQDKMQQQALQQALGKQSLELGQQSLAAGTRAAGADQAMAQALQQAAGPVRQQTVDLQGNPSQPGNPFSVTAGTQRMVTPDAIMQAMVQNPQAVNSPAGRQAVNDFMRTSNRGGVNFTQGPDGSTWAYNQATGQFEPSPLDKINATAAAKLKAAGPTPPGPDQPPQVSKDGKFYYDYHLKTWKPLTSKADLFGGQAGGESTAGAVNYTWKNGSLTRSE